MSRLTKQQIKRLPPYIRLGDKEKGTAMRLDNPGEGLFGNDEYDVEYLRDGGMWSVGVKEVDGKFLSIFNDDDEDSLSNQELFPITRAEWYKDNQGYVSKDSKAYKFKNF